MEDYVVLLFRLGATPPPRAPYEPEVCVVSSVLGCWCWLVIWSFLLFLPFFDFDLDIVGSFLSCGYHSYAVLAVSVSGATCLAYDMHLDTYVRWSHLLIFSEVLSRLYDLLQSLRKHPSGQFLGNELAFFFFKRKHSNVRTTYTSYAYAVYSCVWRLWVVSWSMAARLLAFSSRQFALTTKRGRFFFCFTLFFLPEQA